MRLKPWDEQAPVRRDAILAYPTLAEDPVACSRQCRELWHLT